MEAEAAIGPVRHVLHVPALSLADYGRMQALLLGGIERRGWAGRIGSFLAGGVLGGLLIVLAAWWPLRAEVFVVAGSEGWMGHADSLGAFLLALGFVMLGLLAMTVSILLRQRRVLRRLHALGGEVFGTHELLLGEDGLLWRNPARVVVTPWSRITGTARRDGMLYLLADHVSAFWIPEALIAAHPDRAGLEALLRERVRPGA